MTTNNGKWKPVFIAALRNSGNVRASAAAAGIGRAAPYWQRKHSKVFAAQWQEALEDATDVLAAEARRRALKDSDVLLIYLLKVHGGPEYRNDQRQRVDVHVEIEQNVRRMAAAEGMDEEEIAAAIAEAERLVAGSS